jgi:hypothetical protein
VVVVARVAARVVARAAVIVAIVARSVRNDVVTRRKETNEARTRSIETIEMKIIIEMTTSVNTETRIEKTRNTMRMIKNFFKKNMKTLNYFLFR